MSKLLFFVPPQASSVAGQVDLFFFFMVAVSTFFTVLIAVLLMFFAVRFHKSRAVEVAHGPADGLELGQDLGHGSGAMILEIVWTVIPLAISMVMFVWGTSLYFTLIRPPSDAIQMYAVGKQWMWKFQHPEGKREINELHVPLGQDVKITMSSEDVLHSLFVPSFRVKQDVVPGRYSQLWFRPTQLGTFHLFCAEYCGTQHSGMIGYVVVMEPDKYEAWLAGDSGGSGQSLAKLGEKLFTERACATCHLENGEGRGPSLVNVAGSVAKLEGGGEAMADDTYLRESILNPTARIVAGFQPVMPTFQGQLSEEQLVQLLAYIKSLGPKVASAPPQAPAAKD